MGYGRYIAFRIVNALLVLMLVTLLVSVLFTKVAEQDIKSSINEEIGLYLRGNPQLAQALSKDPQKYHQWYEREYNRRLKMYGLDKPFWIRVLERTKDTLTLNFGQTRNPIFGETNIAKIIMAAVPRTILLFTTAQIIVIFLGILLGVKAAQIAGSAFDRAISIVAMVTSSIPMWWFGMLAILIFSFKLGWFPGSGMTSIPPKTGIAYYFDVLYHMVLPVGTIVFVLFGGWAWTTRNIMIGTMQEDFIMAARAKGVPERKVIYGHALRASAPPIITMTIFALLGSIGGAIITESVFNWPGMGRLYWTAIQQNDVRLVMGITFVTTLLYLFAMILADLLYGYLDPRVKVGASQKT